MSVNILQIIHDVVDEPLLHQVANDIHEPSWNTSVAFHGALHAILGGVMKRVETPQGADQVLQALDGFDDEVLGNVANIVAGGEFQNFSEIGMALTDFVFESQREFLVKELAEHAEVSPHVGKTLVGFAAPLIFAALRRHHATQTLDVDSLGELLGNQKPYLAYEASADLMHHLGLGDMLRASDSELAKFEAASVEAVVNTPTVAESNDQAPRKRKTWVPQLAAIAVILGCLGYLGWPRIPRSSPSSILGRILDATGAEYLDAGDAAANDSATTGVVSVNGVPQRLDTPHELESTQVNQVPAKGDVAAEVARESSPAATAITSQTHEVAKVVPPGASAQVTRLNPLSTEVTQPVPPSPVPRSAESDPPQSVPETAKAISHPGLAAAADPALAAAVQPQRPTSWELAPSAGWEPAALLEPTRPDRLLAIDEASPATAQMPTLAAWQLGLPLAADVAAGSSTSEATPEGSGSLLLALPSPIPPIPAAQPPRLPRPVGSAEPVEPALEAKAAHGTVAADPVTANVTETIPRPAPATVPTALEQQKLPLAPYRRHREPETFYREPAAKNWRYFQQPRSGGFTYRYRLN